MNKLHQLFQLQTTILLNHVLTNLLKLFMNPKETKLCLYNTIIPIKNISKKELLKMGKSVPNLLRYEVWATKSASHLTFTLQHESLSSINIYDVKLIQNPPNINFLKKIALILVTKQKPLPTKVDKEFSTLSSKYFDYLNYHQSQRRWNSGVIRKEKVKNHVQKLNSQDVEMCYDDFINDIYTLQLKYRTFTKILIDIYQSKNEVKYLSTDKTYEISVNFSRDYGISIFITYFNENHKTHEVIKLSDFHPANKFSNTRLPNIIMSCVKPTLTKLYN